MTRLRLNLKFSVNDDTGGYHETITQASLRALKGVLEANPPDMPLYQIVNALMASSMGNPNWLLEYWSVARLMSVEARREWRPPSNAALSQASCSSGMATSEERKGC